MRRASRVFHWRRGAIDIQDHFLGHPVHGQVAGNLQFACTGRLHFFDRKVIVELGHIEEVVAAQVIVPSLHTRYRWSSHRSSHSQRPY